MLFVGMFDEDLVVSESNAHSMTTGAQTENPIAAMTCHKDLTFVAVGPNVLIYSRGREVCLNLPLNGMNIGAYALE